MLIVAIFGVMLDWVFDEIDEKKEKENKTRKVNKKKNKVKVE